MAANGDTIKSVKASVPWGVTMLSPVHPRQSSKWLAEPGGPFRSVHGF